MYAYYGSNPIIHMMIDMGVTGCIFWFVAFLIGVPILRSILDGIMEDEPGAESLITPLLQVLGVLGALFNVYMVKTYGLAPWRVEGLIMSLTIGYTATRTTTA